jgi:hypothetical protein
MRDPFTHDYDAGVEMADGSVIYSCVTCGDMVTVSKELRDRLLADGMRIFGEVSARHRAQRLAQS